MFSRPGGIAAVLVLVLAPTGWAQEQTPPASRPAAAAPSLDVNRLPVNLDRINRSLHQSAREQRDGLNLRYFIDVYGSAPRLNMLDPQRDNLQSGPVPYGAPTRQEIINNMTQPEFRTPAADFSSLIRWFSDKSKK